jgi:hypothetical protein
MPLKALTDSNSRRFIWAGHNDPRLGEEALGIAMDLFPSWVRSLDSDRSELVHGNIAMAQWFDEQDIPLISEVLTMCPQLLTDPEGTDAMTDKNPIAKSIAYADKHDLWSKITLKENGTIGSTEDLVEATAALDAGLTMDQVKKFQKSLGELIPAATHVGGVRAAEGFKADPNLTETGFSFAIGSTQKVSALYNRDSKDHVVVVVETTHRSAEFQRVVTGLNSMFDDINS